MKISYKRAPDYSYLKHSVTKSRLMVTSGCWEWVGTAECLMGMGVHFGAITIFWN